MSRTPKSFVLGVVCLNALRCVTSVVVFNGRASGGSWRQGSPNCSIAFD